tara:strand:- start:288 stop:464 length:177 start_codon:yes stop_codon:yes gene_type:complete
VVLELVVLAVLEGKVPTFLTLVGRGVTLGVLHILLYAVAVVTGVRMREVPGLSFGVAM